MKRSLDITLDLKPYSDNSGYEYRVSLIEREGDVDLRIKSLSQEVNISSADWPSIRDAIDNLLRIAAHPIPGEMK